MFGGDPQQIAERIIAWYGSGAGGKFFLLALLVSSFVAYMGHVRQLIMVFVVGAISWAGAFAASSWFGWQI